MTEHEYDPKFYAKISSAVLKLPDIADKLDRFDRTMNEMVTEIKRMQDWRDRHVIDSAGRDAILDKITCRLENLEKTEYGVLSILRATMYVFVIAGTITGVIAYILK
uniref:Uncharacterized protein n=1 Tax=viral metagenome TaxID=1070528 RepID=A0A6H1ZGP8_9ZZZZ